MLGISAETTMDTQFDSQFDSKITNYVLAMLFTGVWEGRG